MVCHYWTWLFGIRTIMNDYENDNDEEVMEGMMILPIVIAPMTIMSTSMEMERTLNLLQMKIMIQSWQIRLHRWRILLLLLRMLLNVFMIGKRRRRIVPLRSINAESVWRERKITYESRRRIFSTRVDWEAKREDICRELLLSTSVIIIV